MAISTRLLVEHGLRQPGGPGSTSQTVTLHENGHVAGLGLPSATSAVMYPSYQSARCALAADDRAGIAALY